MRMKKLAALLLTVCLVGSTTAAFAETADGKHKGHHKVHTKAHHKMHTKAHHKMHTKAAKKPYHIKAMPKTGMGGTDNE